MKNPSRLPTVLDFPIFSLFAAGSALLVMCSPRLSTLLTMSTDTPSILTMGLSHFAHWSWNHFIWDAVTFLALAALYETGLWRRLPGISLPPSGKEVRAASFLAQLVAACLIISSAVCIFPEGVAAYRGLSGLCTALYSTMLFYGIHETVRHRDCRGTAVCSIMLILACAKLIYEAVSGGTMFVNTQSETFAVVPVAHLAGIVSGLLLFCAGRVLNYMEGRRRPAHRSGRGSLSHHPTNEDACVHGGWNRPTRQVGHLN